MRLVPLLLAFSLLPACGEVTTSLDAADDDAATSIDALAVVDATADAEPAIDAEVATYTVGGMVSGFAGSGLILQLNGGADLEISANGTFTFATALADETAYAVTVFAEPLCPERFCAVSSGTGTISSANVTDVVVSCAEPKYRLASLSWGDDEIRLTDDLLALADGATATPRIIAGADTQLGAADVDGIAFDVQRDLIYSANGAAVLVFTQGSTTSGNVAPARTISVTGDTGLFSVELDEPADRLYVGGSSALHIFNAASTLNGTVTPTATIALDAPSAIALDTHADRLYVGGDYNETLYVFDDASALTSASTPNRTVTWTTTNGIGGPPGVAIDGCNDRLYLGSNWSSQNGSHLFVMANASTLSGAISLEATSVAHLTAHECISADLDSGGRLYCWKDSPTAVWIYNDPSSWSGLVTASPDKTINGVVSRGYGLDVVAY